MRSVGGLPPFRHSVYYYLSGESASVGNDEWLSAPPGVHIGLFSYDSFDGNAQRLTYLTPGLSSPISYRILASRTTSAVDQADGGFSLYTNYGGTTSTIRISNSTDVVLERSFIGSTDVYSLRAGNYTAVLSNRGCSVSFNITVANPPAPIIRNFYCVVTPVGQTIDCYWSPQFLEVYELLFAVRDINETTVPDPSDFAVVRSAAAYPSNFVVSTAYTPGKSYFVKLIARGAGGVVESVIRIEASGTFRNLQACAFLGLIAHLFVTPVALPSRPTNLVAQAITNGTLLSWTQPEDIIKTELTYRVYFQPLSTVREAIVF